MVGDKWIFGGKSGDNHTDRGMKLKALNSVTL